MSSQPADQRPYDRPITRGEWWGCFCQGCILLQLTAVGFGLFIYFIFQGFALFPEQLEATATSETDKIEAKYFTDSDSDTTNCYVRLNPVGSSHESVEVLRLYRVEEPEHLKLKWASNLLTITLPPRFEYDVERQVRFATVGGKNVRIQYQSK